MERPNTKQLEQALCFADTGELSEAEGKWLAAEVRALREELASENSEARRIFTSEFKAELLERTQECDRLREEMGELRGAYDVLLRGEAYQAACSLLNASVAREVDLQATIARIEACVSSAEQRPATWSFRDFVEWLRAALKGEP